MYELIMMAALVVTQLPESVDPSVLAGLIENIAGGTATFGWLGALAATLSGAVAVFRLLLPGVWGKLPVWAKPLIVFAFAGVGAGLMTWLGAVPIGAAIAAGAVAGFTAIGIHQNAKALKSAKVKK